MMKKMKKRGKLNRGREENEEKRKVEQGKRRK
jgi:hypothetical protein